VKEFENWKRKEGWNYEGLLSNIDAYYLSLHDTLLVLLKRKTLAAY